MTRKKNYFLSGIGGSGMLPLALILKSLGHTVSGSDRAYDQGMFPDKFGYLEKQGISLYAQDGSGLDRGIDALVISAAVESDTPDVMAAKSLHIPIEKRAHVLADLFNTFEHRIAVGGTSGKTTVTGMIGFILDKAGQTPVMMNGGNLRDYYTPQNPYPSVLLGESDIFITEADESDGTIALYSPSIAVLNNLALDHKKPEETAVLFRNFIAKAQYAVVNADAFDKGWLREDNVVSYGIKNKARFQAKKVKEAIEIHDTCSGEAAPLKLQIPGTHNLSNALAAISCAFLMGIGLKESCDILSSFSGIKRRLETLGVGHGVTVIDDFAHNPDKIAASLSALKGKANRLLIVFQPHGFGPLKLMGKEIADSFAKHMSVDDVLYVPDVIYWGGTVNREVTSEDLVTWVSDKGRQAHWFEGREAIKQAILNSARAGDSVVIMGARDDSLSSFAQEILEALGK